MYRMRFEAAAELLFTPIPFRKFIQRFSQLRDDLSVLRTDGIIYQVATRSALSLEEKQNESDLTRKFIPQQLVDTRISATAESKRDVPALLALRARSLNGSRDH